MKELDICLLQLDLAWQDAKANQAHIEKKLKTIDKVDLIVLPEMFTTGFCMTPQTLAESTQESTLDWLQGLAAAKNAVICGSIMYKDGDDYVNRLLWVSPDGEVKHYDKRHLFKFAGEDKHYSAGSKREIFEIGEWKVAPFICFDLRFPVWSRNELDADGVPAYDVALYVANWPAARSLQWQRLLQARAIENQSYVLGLNRVGKDANGIEYKGDSLVFDALGETLLHTTQLELAANVTLSKDKLDNIRAKFPFLAEADAFTLTT